MPGALIPTVLGYDTKHSGVVRLQAATEVRKEVNELDNLTTGKAVDVLLNYETVKLFNNEQLEVDQYDAYLLGFQVKTCLSHSHLVQSCCGH